jgi:hypothetical protein
MTKKVCRMKDVRRVQARDTAVERGKNDLRPERTVRHATAVSRHRLPRALHDAGA